MAFKFLPVVDLCCFCVTDLRAACAIIAVLGIVTSPAVSWAVVRHSFVVRVSCIVSSKTSRPDVVDFHISNMLSFGFGANAGLGPSCMTPRNESTLSEATLVLRNQPPEGSGFVNSVRWIGWLVLVADLLFLMISIHFLYRLFKPKSRQNVLTVATRFILVCTMAIFLSFVYSMLYVSTCIVLGGAFPVFEFFFSIIDIIVWAMWIYFVIVVNSFIIQDIIAHPEPKPEEPWYSFILKAIYAIKDKMSNIYANYVPRSGPVLPSFGATAFTSTSIQTDDIFEDYHKGI